MLYDDARRFADNGIVALPAGQGKRPDVPSWKEFQKRHPTEGEHKSWFLASTAQGIGIVTGGISGFLLMVEFEGRALAEDLEIRARELAEASGLADLWQRLVSGFVVMSPGGGLHFYYRIIGIPIVPGNTKLARRKLASGSVEVLIETRGEGGWVIAPPTSGDVHPTGKAWSTLTGGPDTIPTFTVDEHEAIMALCRALDELPEHEGKADTNRHDDGKQSLTGDEMRPGDEFNEKADWHDILTPHGWRLLYRHGKTRYWQRPPGGKPTIGPSATTGHADDADRLFVFTTSTEFDTETPISKFAAHAILNHGGDYAAASRDLRKQGYGDPPAPRPPLRLITTDEAPPYDNGGMLARAMHPSAQPKTEPLPSLSDDGNARLLARRYGHELRYVRGLGWYVWRDGAWQQDERGLAMEMMKATIHAIEITDEKVGRHQLRSLSAGALRSALLLAESMAPIRITADELDPHPTRFNARGQTVDLVTGKSYDAVPSELHTMRAGCNPKRMATPLWEDFLDQTFGGDQELIAYVQRLAGYALTGLQAHHILPFLHGRGQNGKSVFLEVMMKVMGDYAVSTPTNFLMAGGSGHPTEIARLRGKRLVVCNEVNQDDKFDEAKIKTLTGGDRLTGRFMSKDFFDFDPSHHVILAGNHQPRVGAGGESFWRRLRLVPFTIRVPDDKKIAGLADILFAEEGPGILQWAVEGAVEVIERGTLGDPDRVLVATAAYAEEEDALGQFFEERCTFGKTEEIENKTMLRIYHDWCFERGEKSLNPQQLLRELRARYGVERRKSHGQVFYVGVSVTGAESASPRSWVPQ